MNGMIIHNNNKSPYELNFVGYEIHRENNTQKILTNIHKRTQKFTEVKPPRGKHPRSNGIGLPYYSMNEDYNSLQLSDSSSMRIQEIYTFLSRLLLTEQTKLIR